MESSGTVMETGIYLKQILMYPMTFVHITAKSICLSLSWVFIFFSTLASI